MKKNVQQSKTDSIGQSPLPHSEFSDTPKNYVHWSDQDWLDSGLHPKIHSSLSRIDRALQGITAIHDLLAMNFQRNTFLRYHEPDEASPCPFSGLTDNHEEGLHCALRALLEEAESKMRQLRNNDNDCWGRPA
jgi:hypothetical protein